MATIIITIVLNLLIGTPTETTTNQKTTTTTTTTTTTDKADEQMKLMGGSGTWVNIEK